MFGNIAILGVGLIGGSLARALRRAGACRRIMGYGRHETELKKAVSLGVIDDYALDPAHAVARADIVVLAVPLGAMKPLMAAIGSALPPHAILTDVGSAKSSVIADATAAFGLMPERFVPAHPIAGTEQSGVDASFAELFEGRRVILTPLEHTDRAAVEKIRAMWRVAGAVVEEMDALHHDRMLAATSHLPHVVAYSVVNAALQLDPTSAVLRYAGTSFRDVTRVASSDPVMWRDIWLANKDAVLDSVQAFQTQLQALQHAIEQDDGTAIVAILSRAKAARDRLAHEA